jgi:hypothetical protein
MLAGLLVTAAAIVLPWSVLHITSSADMVRERHRLFGAVLLPDRESFVFQGGLCLGAGRYVDLRAGTVVTILDADGSQLAVATLRPGRVTSEGGCEFGYGAVVPEVGSYVFVAGEQPPSRPVTIWTMERSLAGPVAPGQLAGDWQHTLVYR